MVALAVNIHDAEGLRDRCVVAQPACPRREQIWIDGAGTGQADWVAEQYGWRLVVVNKLPDQHGLVVLPRRWVVERTFAWLGRNRRLSKDYEEYAETTEAWVYAAMIRLMLRRFAA